MPDIAERIARIETKLDYLAETSGNNSRKLDILLDRQQEVEILLTSVKQSVLSHNDEDKEKFKKIEKKHFWYDGLIISALCFAIVNLILVIKEMVK